MLVILKQDWQQLDLGHRTTHAMAVLLIRSVGRSTMFKRVANHIEEYRWA